MQRSFKYISLVLVTGLIIFFVFILARKQRPHTRHVVKWQVVNSYYIYQEMIGFVMPVIKK